jgi:enoyl-CoA hydratase
MVVSEAEFEPKVQAIAQAITKLDMKAHHQTKLKARAELLQVLDDCIEKDRHSNL